VAATDDRTAKSIKRSGRGTEIVRFLLGGASTTLVSYAIYLALLRWVPYILAYSIAYAAGIIWSYFVNTFYVFRREPSLIRATLFPLVYLVQFLAGAALLFVFVDMLHVSEALSPLAVIVLTLPLTFVLSRHVITAGADGSAREKR
jgi:putative flippase GtrA